MSSTSGRSTKTICVASGKGGVGKTTCSVNLAMALVRLGRKVLLFDGDMGLANVQIALNCKLPTTDNDQVRDGADYFRELEKLLIETPSGITLLPGINGSIKLASMQEDQALMLVRNFSSLAGRFDYLIIDSAAGVSESVLTFLKASDIRLVVGTNELAAITDAYGLFKSLHACGTTQSLYFIPNKCTTPEQGRVLFSKMQKVVSHFLSMKINELGTVSADPVVNKSWEKSSPLVLMLPQCQVSLEFARIAEKLDRIEIPGESHQQHLRFFG